jgi:hypothetical protein
MGGNYLSIQNVIMRTGCRGSSSRVCYLINTVTVLFNQYVEKVIFFFKKIIIKSDLPKANLT